MDEKSTEKKGWMKNQLKRKIPFWGMGLQMERLPGKRSKQSTEKVDFLINELKDFLKNGLWKEKILCEKECLKNEESFIF